MKAVKSIKPWQLFLVFYGLPAVTNWIILGFEGPRNLITIMPAVVIYLIWLVLLSNALSKKQKRSSGWTNRLLLTAIIVLLPSLVLLWYLGKVTGNPIYAAFLGLLGLTVVVIIFLCWARLSGDIKFLLGHNSRKRKSAAAIFCYFLLGPITIWFLQPAVKEALDD